MIVIPAIDLLNGKCVRLRQGSYDEVTEYSDKPLEIAKRFEEAGASIIHVVDLNGAKDGSPVNFKVIENIVKMLAIPIQVGGGIRTIETAKKYEALGVKRLIVGTKACDASFIPELKKKVDGEIIAGIDAKNGKVAVKGWLEVTDLEASSFAMEVAKKGADAIIYTDISKDGMQGGPNIEATLELKKAVNIPVIASGGVSSEKDLWELAKHDIWGVIVGRAIYEGEIKLEVIKKLQGC